jgi:hypothetical protein
MKFAGLRAVSSDERRLTAGTQPHGAKRRQPARFAVERGDTVVTNTVTTTTKSCTALVSPPAVSTQTSAITITCS